MRTFVLLLVFAIPPLIACGGAYAKSVADIGKPVCTQFDEASKADPVASAQTAPAKVVVAVAVATNATPAASSAASTQAKGGGASDGIRPRNAPHWQTFLPGMFR